MEPWQRRDNTAIVVDAIRLNEDNIEVVGQTIGAELIEEIDPQHPDEMQYGLNVETPTGMKRASLGMYVYKAARHNFVAHVRVFEDAFEPVNRPSPPPESIGDSYMARGEDPATGKRM